MAAIAVVVSCGGAVAEAASGGATALAAPATRAVPGGAPSATFHVPREARPGARVAARGRVSGLDGRASVRVQLRRGGRWRTIAAVATRDGRYRIPLRLRLPKGIRAATLRLAIFIAGRRVAVSAPDRVRLAARNQQTRIPPNLVPPPQVTPTGGTPTASAAAASAPAPSEPTPPAEPEIPPTAEPEAEEPEPEAPGGPIKPSSSIYWGAWIDPGTPEQPAPMNPTAIGQFEAIAGKRPSILESYSAFFQCSDGSGGPCTREYAFPQQQLEEIRQRGAIPLFTWAPESSSGQVTQTDFELSDIASGKWDTYVRKWAEAARDWGQPFFLRFGWEMNGNWFPWGKTVNGNVETDYVAAWRHVHEVFTAVGATNAAWVWCPFVGPRPVSGFYPGDDVVDWTCLDGYNNTLTTAWRSFKQIFTPAYEEITETVAPSKPMLIAETASSEAGAPAGTSKAQWIEAMLAGLPTEFPAVRGLLWFNYEEGGKGWPLTTSTAAKDAFAAGIANPLYLAGSSGGPLTLP